MAKGGLRSEDRHSHRPLSREHRLSAYENKAMWSQVRLDSGTYVWVFLVASDCNEPWSLAHDVEA